MAEKLELVAAVGPNIDKDLLEDVMLTLVRSGWRNSTETSRLTDHARETYFNNFDDQTITVLGRFQDDAVSAAIGNCSTWDHPGLRGEYLGYIGKRSFDIRIFGVREPYRGMGFGTQTLAAVALAAYQQGCSLMAMHWADFQWEWFQARGGFEGKFGLIAESVRGLPITYPGFEPEQLLHQTDNA